MNEFKFSTLRQFGSENVSYTATIHSDKQVLTDVEIDQQINQIDVAISKAFIAVQEREISEKEDPNHQKFLKKILERILE